MSSELGFEETRWAQTMLVQESGEASAFQSQSDLETYIGTRARVSEILGGRRSLTLPMIRRLHEGLGIPAEVLIRPTKGGAARPGREPGKSRRRRVVPGERTSASRM